MNTEPVLRQSLQVLALGQLVENAIVAFGGINTPRKLATMQEKDLSDMGKTISAQLPGRGGIIIRNATV
jgi:hypothetical protein